MAELLHLNIDNITSGWVSSGETGDEISVGRICEWGGHYICVIHDDVPEDEQIEVANYIAAAPEKIAKLRDAVNVALGQLTGGMDGDWRDCDPVEILRNALNS